jgi:tetratricopeptide (TPR) repeat protein
VALGRVLEYRGGDAIPLYRRVLEEYPDDFWANMYLGNSLVKRDPKEAIGHFRAALAVRPKSAVMANNLAVGLRAAGRLDEAIACYERALRLNPGYAPAHNNLGLVLRDKGMLEEAQASFERAIEADPKFLGAHMNLGNLLRRKKEAAKAIECYLQAARLDPGDARPHYSLGLILAEQGQIEAAIKHYQKAVQLPVPLPQEGVPRRRPVVLRHIHGRPETGRRLAGRTPLPRRPSGGPGRLRGRVGRGRARRAGAGALAWAGPRLATA